MQCPYDAIPMTPYVWRSVEVHRCPACFRGWYPAEQLRPIAETTNDSLTHLDIWRDPSGLIFRRTTRDCPVNGQSLYRIVEPAAGLGAEVCHQVHGVLVEEATFRMVGEAVPLAMTAAIGAEYAGAGIFNPDHHEHIAVAHMLAHRVLTNLQHIGRELATLPT
jgi:hypothetical protein